MGSQRSPLSDESSQEGHLLGSTRPQAGAHQLLVPMSFPLRCQGVTGGAPPGRPHAGSVCSAQVLAENTEEEEKAGPLSSQLSSHAVQRDLSRWHGPYPAGSGESWKDRTRCGHRAMELLQYLLCLPAHPMSASMSPRSPCFQPRGPDL